MSKVEVLKITLQILFAAVQIFLMDINIRRKGLNSTEASQNGWMTTASKIERDGEK
jgi:hypothetical protein